MSKQSTIQIHDAKNKGAMGYRVKFVGKNGEPLMTSEVLESVAAVNKNIVASCTCGFKNEDWRVQDTYILKRIVDHTKKTAFVRYGAIPHSKLKTAKK